MLLECWIPFRDFRRTKRLINPSERWSVFRAETGDWYVLLDVVREDESIVMRASLPGIGPNDIDVTIKEGVLTIKGEATSENEGSEEDYLLREQMTGRFHRSLRLPD